MLFSIYKITNKINGKIYIGWTSNNPKKRWYQHYQDAFQGDGSKKRHLHYSMVKHGYDKFKFEVIYQSSNYKHSQEMECHFIKSFNSFKRESGYNLSFGGESNLWTKERKEEWGKRHKGEGNAFFGKSHSEETKKRLSEQRRGIKFDPEVVERRASKLRGRRRNPMVVQSMVLSKIKQHPLFNQIEFISERLKKGIYGNEIGRELYSRGVKNKKGNQYSGAHIDRYVDQLIKYNLISPSIITDCRAQVYKEDNANLILSLFEQGYSKSEIGRILYKKGIKNYVGNPFSCCTIGKIIKKIRRIQN